METAAETEAVRVVWKTEEIQWFREIFICVGVVKVSLEAGVLCFSRNLL